MQGDLVAFGEFTGSSPVDMILANYDSKAFLAVHTDAGYDVTPLFQARGRHARTESASRVVPGRVQFQTKVPLGPPKSLPHLGGERAGKVNGGDYSLQSIIPADLTRDGATDFVAVMLKRGPGDPSSALRIRSLGSVGIWAMRTRHHQLCLGIPAGRCLERSAV